MPITSQRSQGEPRGGGDARARARHVAGGSAVGTIPAIARARATAYGSSTMSTDRKPPGYMTEDLTFREVSGPPSYKGVTEKSVEYIAIASQGDVIVGYLYANDEDDVVGWQPRPAAGHQAHSTYYPWMMKLRDCKARGLKPSAALDELVRDGTDDPVNPASHVVPGSRTQAGSLAALKQIAGVQPPPEEPVSRGRGR